jgi:2-desacetyl-2-hydroxyethyl bacteriochlorophyllide A dehydrogenase
MESSRTMRGVYLPGERRVNVEEAVPVPEPGHGQVLVRMRASTICGSDIRAIYREHLGTGPEAYRNVIAGHEPAGEIVAAGPGCRRFGVGDRVLLYHIAGCGLCAECRRGYMIGCESPLRAAYGWQRDGGHADFLLAEETTCVALPDELSFVDGACVACGFGTAYEALCRAGVSGRDAVLVTGLGPVGTAVGLLARALGARRVVGVDVVHDRLELAREVGAVDDAVKAGAEEGTYDVAVDCSGTAAGRETALAGVRTWGRVVFVGEGGRLDVDVSQVLIHRQLTVQGSWVTSVGRMEELTGLLVHWDLRPERIVTHRFGLDEAAEAYRVADGGSAGKVALVMP